MLYDVLFNLSMLHEPSQLELLAQMNKVVPFDTEHPECELSPFRLRNSPVGFLACRLTNPILQIHMTTRCPSRSIGCKRFVLLAVTPDCATFPTLAISIPCSRSSL